MITENGIADKSDARRWEYIEKALSGLRNAMDKGPVYSVICTGHLWTISNGKKVTQ